MLKSGGRLMRALAAMAVLGASASGAAAQENFTFPAPDLTVVKPCVADNKGDIAAAAQCYAAFETICFDSRFAQYGACLPHEVAYWSAMLNRELQWSAGPEAAPGSRRKIDAEMAAHCPAPKPKYRQVCEAHYLRDNAVLLHMRRIWAGGELSN